jgi:hypothetical protein
VSDDNSGFFGNALTSRLLKRVPGGGFVQEQLERIEHRVMSELKQRLDKVERSATVSVLAFSVQPDPAQVRKRGRHAPGELLRELLEAATDQTREQAEQAWYVAVLKQLVPDEARILSTLSESPGHPLIHVMAGPRLGGGTHPVLRHLSNVGRLAGVKLAELSPLYIQRLRDLGLVETGPEDPASKVKYEILESDGTVRRLVENIRKKGQREVLLRRTLRLSEPGRALWAACRISED